jgi:adenylate kinase family enzyme
VQARRILVHGVTGSGKSTLAARISAATGIPWTSVDDLTWEPDWVQVPEAEQRRRMEAICSRDSWILDTAYTAWRDVPLATVELVVALDYPRWLSLGRLLRRTALRIVDRRPICNGNVESLRGTLSRESIIVWHFRTFRSKHEQVLRWLEDPGGLEVVRLTSMAETERWLTGLG